MFVRCSNSSSDIFAAVYQNTRTVIDATQKETAIDQQQTTTKLWNAEMSTSSNHTKAFVQCCHGRHTLASSRTLLFCHVRTFVTISLHKLFLNRESFRIEIEQNHKNNNTLYIFIWVSHEISIPLKTLRQIQASHRRSNIICVKNAIYIPQMNVKIQMYTHNV